MTPPSEQGGQGVAVGFADADYLRRGKERGYRTHILTPEQDALIDARLSGLPNAPAGAEVYANPAASQAMLDDPAFDFEGWLVTEIAYDLERCGQFVRGPTHILRDPFTNKPFVHFYCTRGAQP